MRDLQALEGEVSALLEGKSSTINESEKSGKRVNHKCDG